jgi:hypothetical protein
VGELRCSGRVNSSCSTSGTRRVNIATNPVVSREWGKDREVFTTSGTYPWSFVTQIFHSGQPSHGGDRKMFEVMTSILPKGTLGSVASLLSYLPFKYFDLGSIWYVRFDYIPTATSLARIALSLSIICTDDNCSTNCGKRDLH